MRNTLTLSIPGYTIAAKTWGQPHLPPLLAVHGWLDNANSFNFLGPLLGTAFYCVAIDLPGHGFSSHAPLSQPYHFTDSVFYLAQIIESLNCGPVHIVGHSLGACLTSLFAGVLPDLVQSLVLIEALGPFSRPAETCCQQLRHYFHGIQEDKKRKAYDSLKAAALARARSGHLSLEYALILSERGVIEDQGKFYWRHDRKLLNPSPLYLTETQIISCLQAIEAKTLLILAKQGFDYDQNLMKPRIQAVKNLQVLALQGGHHLHMEYPDVLKTHLDAFYEQAL